MDKLEEPKPNPPRERTFRSLDSWWLDFKLGFRMLIKYPGLALIGGFGIAVGVAIAAGGFSVIFSNFLATSLPLEEGDRIVSIEVWDSAASKPERRILHDFQAWQQDLKSIREIGAFRTITPTLILPGVQPESVRVASISASGFSVPRVSPLMGRRLTEADEREGAPSVVVIGESVWRNRFAADPAILGRTLQLGATPYAIVGVMPEGFAFPVNHRLWVPLRAGSPPPQPLTGPELMVFGRLAPGASLATAQAELTAIGRRSAVALPEVYAQLSPRVMPYPNPFLGLHETKDASELLTMNLVIALLLVLVCLNVAILVYTRTAMRQAEIALRTALGARRGRIVVQLFIEALVLSVAGAITGVVIAAFAMRQIGIATLHIASELPFWLSFQLSPGAVWYSAALSVLAAAIVGIVPALKATRGEVQTGLRVIGAGGSGMRLGKTWTVLVIAQVAFAVALLPGAVSLSWQNLRAEFVDPGFAAEEFLTAQLGMDYPPGTNQTPTGARDFTARYARFHQELMRRLEAEPRISSATFSLSIPGDEPGGLIETENGPAQLETASTHSVRFNRVAINFFRAFDVPVLAGRGFEPADVAPGGAESTDTTGAAVVINQSFAQRAFGGNALGRRIRYSPGSRTMTSKNGQPGRWYQIIGIVKDFPTGVSPSMNDAVLKLYHPVAVGQVQPAQMALRVRGAAPSTFSRRLSEVTAAVDPDLHVRNVIGLVDALHKEQWIRRLEAAVVGAVAVSVLLLSSAGIYALMSFTVSQRRKEIGIRMALGADRKRIIAGIFSRAFAQLAVGAVLGIAAAAALENATGGSLMRNNAVPVLLALSFFVMGIGFLAALGPARRSLRIAPTEALREQ